MPRVPPEVNEHTAEVPNYERWLHQALEQLGGCATRLDVYKEVWRRHGDELGQSEAFYTWQYDIHMAAETLRKSGVLEPVHGRKDRPWSLRRDDPQLPLPLEAAPKGGLGDQALG